MNLLLEIYDSDLYNEVVDADLTDYSVQEAARTVVFDENGRVPLLKVSTKNYYKLPGGGIEVGETAEQALRRELREEIGCEVNITGEVGMVIQYLDRKKLKQISYCYLTNQIGTINQPDFTDEEIADEFEIIWTNNIDAAIKLIKSSQTDDYSGQSIVARDTALLIKAKELIHG